jgi:hypothetical protein
MLTPMPFDLAYFMQARVVGMLRSGSPPVMTKLKTSMSLNFCMIAIAPSGERVFVVGKTGNLLSLSRQKL